MKNVIPDKFSPHRKVNRAEESRSKNKEDKESPSTVITGSVLQKVHNSISSKGIKQRSNCKSLQKEFLAQDSKY
jgi:hypothetical protein